MNPFIEGQQPSWRLWGEEKTEDAIYTVYLKKVRYHPCAVNTINDSEDEKVSHLEWETIKVKVIKAGTLEKLVESLATDAGELEPTYVNVFLSTYRSFATPQQVLTLLLDRYRQLGSNKIQMKEEMRQQHRKTLIQALLVWLDTFQEDFRDPPQYLSLHQIVDFSRRYLPGDDLEVRARHKIEKFRKEEDAIKGAVTLASEVLWSVGCERPLESVHNCLSVVPYDFLEMPEEHVAAQLTRIDADLFKKVVPYHCLGSMWSRREKHKGWEDPCSSVTATVNQFNAVSLRVISTILSDVDTKPTARAKVLAKWIDIAQELRLLKNFSSLKAIIAALQTNAIYRLRRDWLALPREKVDMFTELARIFSEDNNQMAFRELLYKEGSAKFVEVIGEDDSPLQKVVQRHISSGLHSSVMLGTIPYLGTFLTDLTMIDTAIPDFLPDGLVNFDKRRKEFEVLAQIRLLQSAAKNYCIAPDPRFLAWFESVPVLNENESYQLSCLIEPQGFVVPANGARDKRSASAVPFTKSCSVSTALGHRKNDSTSSTSTSSSSSQWYDQISSDTSINSIQHDNSAAAGHELKSSASAVSLSGSCTQIATPTPSLVSQVDGSPAVPEFYIIRVSVDLGQDDTNNGQQGVIMYKSIMLSNHDHTPTVIRNALMKHGLDGNPSDYTLAQVLPDRDVVLPSSANVFYAINTTYDLNFVLRKKHDTRNTNTTPSSTTTTMVTPLKQRAGGLMKRLLSTAST